MSRIVVIGIDEPVVSARLKQLLGNCRQVIGSRRFAPLAEELGLPFAEISPLAEAFNRLRRTSEQGESALLVGGDPLFYGIGRKLLAEFGPEGLEFHPATTSLQRACALLRLPWDDAAVTSLHGRSHHHLPALLLHNAKNLLFTDAANSPNRIAATLLDYLRLIEEEDLAAKIEVGVAEDLGLASQRIFRGSLGQAAVMKFSPLNVMALLVPGAPSVDYRFGLGEEQLHHSRGLITKNEVRAATLHRLRLPDQGVLWDIGAGSGSVSIEAARLNPRLVVYAIERNETELANIKANIRKFRCYNVIPVAGRAPESCAALPAPQRIFIGGSGGSLAEIVAMAASRLAEGGLMVVNGVIAATIETAPRLMAEHRLDIEQSTLQVSRREGDGTLTTFNPITIVTGRK